MQISEKAEMFVNVQVQFRNGFPVPDPICMPGGINSSVTVHTLRDPAWHTRYLRNRTTRKSQKHIAYRITEWHADVIGIRSPHAANAERLASHAYQRKENR
jgi:hypothetical protein